MDWRNSIDAGGMTNTDILILGLLVFLVVIFLFGVLVNVPAAFLYCRSRQIRGFTDKFILFVLIVDILSLFIFLPISFIFVLEYNGSLSESETPALELDDVEKRPLFFDEDNEKVVNIEKVGELDADAPVLLENKVFTSYCVQQWVFILHKLILIMAANLSTVAALKIAVERYLAVVAPLHYHKLLKSSIIFCVSLFSFVISLAFAVTTALDPSDLPQLLNGECVPAYFSHQSLSSVSKSKHLPSVSMRFDSDENTGHIETPLVKDASSAPYQSYQKFDDSASFNSVDGFLWWWPVLKLVHAAVFFLLPVSVMIFMYLRIRSEAHKQNLRMSCRTKSSFIIPPSSATAEVTETDAKKSVGFSAEGLQQVFSKFKLVQRIRRKARMDRAARVAVLTIGLTVLCFGTLFFVQITSAVVALSRSSNVVDLPWDSLQLLPTGRRGEGAHFAKFLLPTLLACLHPLFSPLVYLFRYKRVRVELKALIKKVISSCTCSKRTGSSEFPATVGELRQVIRQFDQCTKLHNKESHHTVIEVDPTGDMKPIHSDSNTVESEDEEQDTEDLVGTHSTTSENDSEQYIQSQNRNATRRISLTGRSSTNHTIEGGRSFAGGLLHIVGSWMSSYSRRWNQHRDSVTSTASFITLLSNRSKSISSASSEI